MGDILKCVVIGIVLIALVIWFICLKKIINYFLKKKEKDV